MPRLTSDEKVLRQLLKTRKALTFKQLQRKTKLRYPVVRNACIRIGAVIERGASTGFQGRPRLLVTAPD